MGIMFGYGRIFRNSRKGRVIDEIVNRMGGRSRKMNKRSTIDSQWGGRPKYVSGIGGGKNTTNGAYPTYEKSVNKTQPVTSPRKLYKVAQGREALSNKPETNESGNPATGRDMELVKAKGRAMQSMWGDNAIGRARSRLARGEQLLPHQSSAWTKHKNSSRGRGY